MDITQIIVTAAVGIIVSAITAHITYRINARQERRWTEHEIAARIAAIPSVRDDATRIVAVQYAEGVLVIQRESGVGNDRVFLPTGSRVTMGSDIRNHIVVDYPRVSKTHASFRATNSDAFVEPLGSANPVVVSGRLVSGPTKLNSGDIVTIDGVSQFSIKYIGMTPSK
jgi:pSer/pThr/pTyr-binding forkhead associated (FHA) protein